MRTVGRRSVGRITFQEGDFATAAAASDGRNASNGTALVDGSRIIGASQRSISLSNTERLPIQKMANIVPPSTTPPQVCNQFIDARNVGSMSAARSDQSGETESAAAEQREYDAQSPQVPFRKAPEHKNQVQDEPEHAGKD